MDVVTEQWRLPQLPEKEHLTVTEACHRCGVSRKTYYKWRNRFREEGIDGLKNRSRNPGLSPRKTDAQVESEIVRIKAEFPRWGEHTGSEIISSGKG